MIGYTLLCTVDSTVGSCKCHFFSIDSVSLLLLATGIDAIDRISSVVLCAIDKVWGGYGQ